MEYVKMILKGMLIGVANIIPGVSGGTMAVSMGIYDKLIWALTHICTKFRQCLKIVIPILLGMVLGIGVLSFAITYLFEYYPFQTGMTFVGLIFGGIPILYHSIQIKKFTLAHILCFVLAFALVVGLQYMKGAENENFVFQITVLQIVKLFAAGVIAAATMVIPGVSGSMIMMLMGYYTAIVGSISSFIRSLLAAEWGSAIHEACILVPFGIGVLIGIFLMAKLISVLLEHARGITYMAIFGLVASSPFAVFMQMGIRGLTVIGILGGIICFVGGFALAFLLGKHS